MVVRSFFDEAGQEEERLWRGGWRWVIVCTVDGWYWCSSPLSAGLYNHFVVRNEVVLQCPDDRND